MRCMHWLIALIVFIEGYAARQAGMDVRIMIRPGNKPLSESEKADFQTATTFDDI